MGMSMPLCLLVRGRFVLLSSGDQSDLAAVDLNWGFSKISPNLLESKIVI